jgi:hydrogenase expression/formation protein
MSDLEGIVRTGLERGLSSREISNRICEELLFYKKLTREKCERISEIILEEVLNSLKTCSSSHKEFFCVEGSGVSAGLMGVGSRGFGDFFFHRLLTQINPINTEGTAVELDDAGWIKIGDKWIIVAVDGIHSRLAYFPLLAGFHAARAAARDVLVKGGVVSGFLVDLRLADDGDVEYLLELEAGVAVVSKFLGAPILGGSTLRIGGDMVIGRRLVATVFAVGVSDTRPRSRRGFRVGDKLIMTEGIGGGTVATTAIFSGKIDIALKTINFKTISLLKRLIESRYIEYVNSLFDVTNGGLRGDLNEISRINNIGFYVRYSDIERVIDPDVLNMLRELNIDPLGLSLDSIVLSIDPHRAEDLLSFIRGLGLRAEIIGEVINKPEVLIEYEGSRVAKLEPKYRESAYTKIKKFVGEESPENLEEILSRVEKSFYRAIKLRDELYNYAIKRTFQIFS